MNALRVIEFLHLIGLRVEPGRVSKMSFLPGVRVNCGGLVFSKTALASDLLHEAGHLAVIPSQFRSLMSGNLNKGTGKSFKLCEHLEPDDPLVVNLLQAGECEATAWSWAAGVHLGLPENEIITDASFDGTGADVRFALSKGCYLGINGLARARFCALPSGRGIGLKYPTLERWLQT